MLHMFFCHVLFVDFERVVLPCYVITVKNIMQIIINKLIFMIMFLLKTVIENYDYLYIKLNFLK